MNQPLINIGGKGITIKVGERTFEPAVPHEQSEVKVHSNVRESRGNKRERKIRSTSFNVADPLERQLNAHANNFSCFSTYVKRLIHQDVLRAGNTSSPALPEVRYHDVMTSKIAAANGGVK